MWNSNVVGEQVVRTKARQLVAKRTPPNAVARRVAELTTSLPDCMVRRARGRLTRIQTALSRLIALSCGLRLVVVSVTQCSLCSEVTLFRRCNMGL